LRYSKTAEMMEHFPYDVHPNPRVSQIVAVERMEMQNGLVTLELPTGGGKGAVGMTLLREGEANGEQNLHYIVPNKTQVEQLQQQFPEVKVAMGRCEHKCLYYGPEHPFRADEVPCLLLADCPHRVNQETGETFEPNAEPCPYYREKFLAKQGGIVVQTMAFYLFTHLLAKEFEPADRLVIDEAHRIAEVFRGALSYEITDHHLRRSIEFLQEIGATEDARKLKRFLVVMVSLIRKRRPHSKTLLENDEIIQLINILAEVDDRKLKTTIAAAIKSGQINTVEKREILKKIETLIYSLRRYLLSLEYSRFDEKRSALNYTYAYYEEEKSEGQKVQHKLVVKGYYVAPLIQKVLAPKTLAMSATIGNPEYFGFETGIKSPFFAMESDFPPKNTRIFLPTDNADLSFNKRSRQDLNRTLRRMIRSAKRFAKSGTRSLIVVNSEEERGKVISFSLEEGLDLVSYGKGIHAREALARFKDGEGDALVGTAAHYGEAVDLPKGLAQVIFFLRPGYPNPNDPMAQFEDRKFPQGHKWALWKWRVMIQALQVRGRNMRSKKDKGVTFFMSSQFENLLYHAMPEELRSKQVFFKDKTFDECVAEAELLLQ